jgi:hypothetical protein
MSSNGQLVLEGNRALSGRQAKCPALCGLSWIGYGRWRDATSNAITRIPTVIPTMRPSRNPTTVHGVYSRGSHIPR